MKKAEIKEMTIKVLKAELDKVGVEYKAKATKAELTKALIEASKKVSGNKPDSKGLKKNKGKGKAKAQKVAKKADGKAKKAKVKAEDKAQVNAMPNTAEIKVEDVFQAGVLVYLSSGKWGAKARVTDATLETMVKGEDKEVVKAVQHLIKDRSLIDTMRSIGNEAKRHVKAISMPFPIPRLYFVPYGMVLGLDEYLERKKVEYFEAVEIFLTKYDELKAEFSEKHPMLFRPELYPTRDALKAKFRFEWSFRSFDVPNAQMKKLSPELYQKEVAKAEKQVKEMAEMTVGMVATALVNKVASLHNQASDNKLNRRTVNAITKVLDDWTNIWSGFVGQEQLESTIKDMKKLVGSIDVDAAKDNDKYREKIRKEAEKAVKTLEKMPDVKAKRSIVL